MGDWVAILATLSLAEELAGSSGIVLALVSRILPGLFFAAIGGVAADRLPRKTVMLVTEIGRAFLVLGLAFVSSITWLVIVNLGLEALTLVFQPAKEASVPSLVQRNELVQANSLSLSAAYGTFPIGALLFLAIAPLGDNFTIGGILPGTQEGVAFLVDSLTYLVSAAIIITLPHLPRAVKKPRRTKEGIDFTAPLRDFREGVVFVATHPRVRPVVLAMTVGLAGGGIVIVLGKPFATDVLLAGTTGFPALLTAFGMGAASGIILVTIFGPRFAHKEVIFAIALLVTGVALTASGFVKTIFGAVGWITLMGAGAGAAYVLGFAHLHEQVLDEVRGRTFAALFSLMRIGLLTSMTIALPLSGALDGALPGLLAEGSRMVLILGGAVIFFGGLATLWSVRRLFAPDPAVTERRRSSMDAASEAFRSYRESVSGHDPDPTSDIDAVEVDPVEGPE